MTIAADDFTPAQAKRWVAQEAPKYDTVEMIDMFVADQMAAWPTLDEEYPNCDAATAELTRILRARRIEMLKGAL